MINIYLEGKLGRIFGKKWTLDVKSPIEAIRAIDINLKGKLIKYLTEQGDKKYYKIALQKKDNILNKEEVVNLSGKSDIYIIPAIKGANSGVGKLLAAIAIVILVVVAQQYEFLPQVFGTAAKGIFSASVFVQATAAALFLGGVSQLLAPNPNFNQSSSTDQKQSSYFQGNTVAISQGGSVPVAYGRVLISPMPISISITSYNQASTEASIGDVTSEELPGGGYQYYPAS